MKKLFVATAIVLGTLAFAACGGENKTDGANTDTTSTETTISGEEAAADAIDSVTSPADTAKISVDSVGN